MPPYWFLQRWKVASLIPRSFATCGTEAPAASFASASRSLRTICSGVWRLFFTESPPPSLAHLEQSDSHSSWISFRGAGQWSQNSSAHTSAKHCTPCTKKRKAIEKVDCESVDKVKS